MEKLGKILFKKMFKHLIYNKQKTHITFFKSFRIKASLDIIFAKFSVISTREIDEKERSEQYIF